VSGVTLRPGESTVIAGKTLVVGTSGLVTVNGKSTSVPTIVAGKTSTGPVRNSAVTTTSTAGSSSGITSSRSTSSSASRTTSGGVGGAIASGVGATKKGDAIRASDESISALSGLLVGAVVWMIGYM